MIPGSPANRVNLFAPPMVIATESSKAATSPTGKIGLPNQMKRLGLADECDGDIVAELQVEAAINCHVP